MQSIQVSWIERQRLGRKYVFISWYNASTQLALSSLKSRVHQGGVANQLPFELEPELAWSACLKRSFIPLPCNHFQMCSTAFSHPPTGNDQAQPEIQPNWEVRHLSCTLLNPDNSIIILICAFAFVKKQCWQTPGKAIFPWFPGDRRRGQSFSVMPGCEQSEQSALP